VPLSESRAKELGITKHPPTAPSALGFGNPPDGVPASAKDMPTEAERKKAEAKAARARDEIEKAKAASAASTQANRAVTAARNERKAAEKALKQANGAQIPKAAEKVFEAKRHEAAAKREAERKKYAKGRTEQAAKKATAGVPMHWEPTEKEVRRRFGKYGKDYIEMMRALKTAKPTTKNGRPAFEVPTPNGGSIIIQEGDLIREKLNKYIMVKKGEMDFGTEEEQGDNEERKRANKELEARRAKLRKIKFTNIPEDIRENAKQAAKAMRADMMTEPENVEEALLNANTGYSFKTEFSDNYKRNCQRCVVAFEARCRGLDVVALPSFENDHIKKHSRWADAYENGRENIIPVAGDTGEIIKKNMDEIISKAPDGARFIVRTSHQKGTRIIGHVFNAFKKDGEIFYVDSQRRGTPEQFEHADFFANIFPQGSKILRIDNLKFSSKIANYVTSRPKTIKRWRSDDHT
jgi:hypothetical protein